MTSASTSTRHIGLLLFDDVEELDAVGPWEVLSYWTHHHPEDHWSISCLSRDGAPVLAAKGAGIDAHDCRRASRRALSRSADIPFPRIGQRSELRGV